jgi:hypothetical protein
MHISRSLTSICNHCVFKPFLLNIKKGLRPIFLILCVNLLLKLFHIMNTIRLFVFRAKRGKFFISVQLTLEDFLSFVSTFRSLSHRFKHHCLTFYLLFSNVFFLVERNFLNHVMRDDTLYMRNLFLLKILKSNHYNCDVVKSSLCS